jgi:NAD(P)-dependent dehydrogenase (short-subunit alcohol dehydrogenase family)
VTAGAELQTQAQLLQRIGQPEAIANMALFLASDESEWITGSSMLVAAVSWPAPIRLDE